MLSEGIPTQAPLKSMPPNNVNSDFEIEQALPRLEYNDRNELITYGNKPVIHAHDGVYRMYKEMKSKMRESRVKLFEQWLVILQTHQIKSVILNIYRFGLPPKTDCNFILLAHRLGPLSPHSHATMFAKNEWTEKWVEAGIAVEETVATVLVRSKFFEHIYTISQGHEARTRGDFEKVTVLANYPTTNDWVNGKSQGSEFVDLGVR